MNLLLDTHVLIWWWKDCDRMSSFVRAALADPDNRIFVSSATAWEVATKIRIGKLDPSIPVDDFEEQIAADGFLSLAVSSRHGLRAGGYAIEHRDPFDRMLGAQSELEDMALVTRDPVFAAFPCRTLW